jgi:hypothetical protein
VYLVAVVLLVRRQIYQVEEAKEEEDMIIITDKKGKTDIRLIDDVLSDSKEVLM